MSTRAAERPPVALGDVARAVPGARLAGDGAATRVAHLFQDSRAILPGSIFAVRRGERRDGRAFVDDAIARGAVAVLTDDEGFAAGLAVPALIVPDARAAIGPAALSVYGYPFERLDVVGVTGTNGKTTTTQLLGSALSSLGARPAVLGTLGCRFEGQELAGTHTTPEADELIRVAAGLVERGATHLIMEVSSHALSLARVDAVRFRAAGFTNLTQDHLDFHGTMQAYGEAKARLFTGGAFSLSASVINVDDPFGAALAARSAGRVLRVSPSGSTPADVSAVSMRMGADGLVAEVALPSGRVSLRSPLVGAHNLENLLLALGLCVALGFDAGAAAAALGEAPAVPGRLERCSEAGDEVLVLVDYAHTPDALARVLSALRPLCEGALWCVFGCGGDRDAGKRAPMGEAAARGADRLVLTNDNPRTEAPEAIAEAVLEGVARAGVPRGGGRCEVVLDRAAAIERAVLGAAPGDTVLIAGKGHEPYQIIGGVSRPFDDREEARAALSRRAGGR
jgi:UDP-N-acetylmuramoyl-L-alanyl-D-glutamate--2,6-diaminopimelate ligase